MPWFGRKKEEQVARSLYEQIIARAREPLFYESLGVPDSVDGRFEMIALHLFLVLRRLKQAQPPLELIEQGLFDLFMLDMDQSLREMGAGDLGVGKKVKRMATAVYGRIKAYNEGLASAVPGSDGGDGLLEQALHRNLYGTVSAPMKEAKLVTNYVRSQAQYLEAQEDSEIAGGKIAFGPLPVIG